MIRGGRVTEMRARSFAARVVVTAVTVATLTGASAASGATGTTASSNSNATAPISGIVRSAGRPIAGATLVVRAFVSGVESVVAMLRSEEDGTFVLPDARPGLYSIVTLTPGFRPAVARILHRSGGELVSFVPLDLERAGGVLPSTPLGPKDPWVARALVRGDVLRQAEGVLAAIDGGEDAPALPGPATATAVNATTRAALAPVRASVASMAGFGTNGPVVSRTLLDVSGGVGESVRFGVEGQYSRTVGEDARAGDSSRLALDLAPGAEQSFHVTTRRKVLPRDDDPGDPSRFAAHSIDWSGATGAGSQASISARLVSQSNLIASGPAADLFAHATRAFEVRAKYRSEVIENGSIGLTVSYRSASSVELVAIDDRETRVGGTASYRPLPFLVVEGGATGDFSPRSHGFTPELTIAIESGGFRAYGSAARRWESGGSDLFQLGVVGVDDEDLTHRARSLVRGGVLYRTPDGASLTFEVARREMGSTYRYLLEPDFVERLDSLYYFGGDVATEISSGATFKLGDGIEGRLSGRGGRIEGERQAAIQRDDAAYAMVEAAVRVAPTDTVVGVGWRSVAQTLSRGEAQLRNDLAAIDFSVAQVLPMPMLRGSEWKALFSLELGKRREGLDSEKSNRQLAGGFAVGFN
jgi:hypothetical protein